VHDGYDRRDKRRGSHQRVRRQAKSSPQVQLQSDSKRHEGGQPRPQTSGRPHQDWKTIAKLGGTVPDKGEATARSLQAGRIRWNSSAKNLEHGQSSPLL